MTGTFQYLALSLLYLGAAAVYGIRTPPLLHTAATVSRLPFFATSFSRRDSLKSATTRIPRGGSTEEDWDEDTDEYEEEESEDLDEYEEEEESEEDDIDEEEESEEEEFEESEEEESEEEEEDPLASVISSQPVTLTIKTNLGVEWLDQSIELMVSRTRDVASVKQTLARQLPGRPPPTMLKLVLDSQELSNDQLVDELVDEEEEDDEDESSDKGLVLLLDMAPPVDPKFATASHMDKFHGMSTLQLLEAYAANVAAMNYNGQLLLQKDDTNVNDDEEEEEEASASLLTSVTLRQDALRIRTQLTAGVSTELLEDWSQPPAPPGAQAAPQRRGQRYRSSAGGAKTNMKRVLQRNLNINWPDTVRNCLLFIFFGLFGGRNTVSKNLLLLGAPLCFVLQARPVKIWLKQGFYAMSYPPGILLSLLPAPQQALLSFRENKAWMELYGKPVGDSLGVDEEEDSFDDEDDEESEWSEENEGDDYDEDDSTDEEDYDEEEE